MQHDNNKKTCVIEGKGISLVIKGQVTLNFWRDSQLTIVLKVSDMFLMPETRFTIFDQLPFICLARPHSTSNSKETTFLVLLSPSINPRSWDNPTTAFCCSVSRNLRLSVLGISPFLSFLLAFWIDLSVRGYVRDSLGLAFASSARRHYGKGGIYSSRINTILWARTPRLVYILRQSTTMRVFL